VGPYIACTAQEAFTNITDGAGNPIPDIGMAPLPPTNSNNLFYVGIDGDDHAVIADFKQVALGGGGAPASGALLNKYTQQIFLSWIDWNGNLQSVSLGFQNYATYGVDGSTWQIYLVT
jgi:hypothetical protein